MLNVKGFKFKIIYFIGDIMYLLLAPFFNIFILIKCLFTYDNLQWGNIKSNELVEIVIDPIIS